jgi:predicted O-methyltransferase YrrM
MSSPAPGTVPPQQILMRLVLGIPINQMIATAAELGIPAQLGDGPKSAADVARAVGTEPDATHRLMRGLSALGIFEERPSQEFALTPVGECLLPDRPGSFHALARLNASSWMAPVFGQLGHSIRTNESAFRKHHGESLFAWLREHSAEQELFGHAMSTFSGMEIEMVLGAYDFSRARHVVDVGGGHGLVLSRILGAAPQARGTLFDQPDVVKQAKPALENAGLASRCEVVGGDFFARVPAGGDLYLLKHILHDWDDDSALRILKSVADAMSPGAKLLVIEQGIAEPGIPNPGKIMDVIMLTLVEGGRERTAKQHAALFEKVGLRLEREIRTPGPVTLFEGIRP